MQPLEIVFPKPADAKKTVAAGNVHTYENVIIVHKRINTAGVIRFTPVGVGGHFAVVWSSNEHIEQSEAGLINKSWRDLIKKHVELGHKAYVL